MSNTFGRLFRLTTFGESHGPAVGGIVDGCPAGLELDPEFIQRELDLRSAAHGGPGATARREPDRLRILSGLFQGRTLGTPIAFLIENRRQDSGEYEAFKNLYRPGHADYPWEIKYGLRDWRGGGRASGRETAARVAGGAIALQLLQHLGIRVYACTLAIGGVRAEEHELAGLAGQYPPEQVPAWLEQAESRPLFAPSDSLAETWRLHLAEAAQNRDSLGGLVRLQAYGLPAGLGEPVFDKLDARIGAAMFGVGAVKGVEIGAGFQAAELTGSRNNDPLLPGETGNTPSFASNNAGGVLGGLSSGQPLSVTVAVKPIPSIGQTQDTVDSQGRAAQLRLEGRHDVCAIPRINPVLKAMLALTLADFALLGRATPIT